MRHNMPDELKTLNNRLLDMSPQVPPKNLGNALSIYECASNLSSAGSR